MAGSQLSARIKGAFCASALIAGTTLASAQGLDPDGKVLSFDKIITVGLGPGDAFGDSTTGIGDLDGNGVPDVAVGAPGDDDGGADRGAVWILFLDSTGGVIGLQKISDTIGGFGGTLGNGDGFGTAVDSAGDLDGDGRNELAVGTDDERLFVLFLDTDGTVLSEQEIGAGTGGFSGALSAGDGFGSGLGSAGDINGDGIPELAVGAPGDDDGGSNRGAVWILVMNDDGTVSAQAKISSTSGGFGTGLLNGDAFGTSVDGLEDMDGNGVPELVVGAPLTNGVDFIVGGAGGGGTPVAAADEGVVFVLFMNANGSVASKVEIGEGLGGFKSKPFAGVQIGVELTSMGDIDGNGVVDFAVGVENHATLLGAVGGYYEIFLNSDGTVARERLVTDKLAGFKAGFLSFLLNTGDRFAAPAYVGDIDGDCKGDMIIGAAGDDAAGANLGSIWVHLLEGELQADTTIRNGSGTNALAYSGTNEPRLGRNWTAEVDVTGHPGATLSIIFGATAPDTVPFTFGEILVSLTATTDFVDTVIPVGGIGSHTIPIPLDLALVGYQSFSQGLIGGGAGPELVNAVDLKLGW